MALFFNSLSSNRGPVFKCEPVLWTRAMKKSPFNMYDSRQEQQQQQQHPAATLCAAALRSVYLRFSGLKARFRSVSTYLVHFSTAFGLVMKGLVSTPFLCISALFFTHRFTSVTPDISFPCVPPKIATLLASLKHALLL